MKSDSWLVKTSSGVIGEFAIVSGSGGKEKRRSSLGALGMFRAALLPFSLSIPNPSFVLLSRKIGTYRLRYPLPPVHLFDRKGHRVDYTSKRQSVIFVIDHPASYPLQNLSSLGFNVHRKGKILHRRSYNIKS